MATPKMTLAAIMAQKPGVDLAKVDADPRITLEKLFRGRSAGEWRAEYAGAFDWGSDLGREIVDG